ncbi:hypothetical protein H6P81_006591 [Aristolochia fimbriata]|uniref:Uncharacterized protein n=1 Tax=Aristolochia fimbriata TaxID=158543 RepID=A0AAV7F174_ARIFI|nr:hypothetical protein H6P81_006591 [Aristolochia fimbriata]
MGSKRAGVNKGSKRAGAYKGSRCTGTCGQARAADTCGHARAAGVQGQKARTGAQGQQARTGSQGQKTSRTGGIRTSKSRDWGHKDNKHAASRCARGAQGQQTCCQQVCMGRKTSKHVTSRRAQPDQQALASKPTGAPDQEGHHGHMARTKWKLCQEVYGRVICVQV